MLSKQLQLQRSIERWIDNFKKIGRNNLNPAKIRSRIMSLKETWSQYLNGHADLVKTVSEPNQATIAYFKDQQFEKTEDVYQTALDHMAECLEELEPPVSHNVSLIDANQARQESSSFSPAHLPQIDLLPFDGKCDDWENFRDRFTSLIINNKELRNFARMHFLVSSVKGSALECIRKIPVTADNFKVAWQTLVARFENKRRLVGVHLSNLLNLPSLARESASDLRGLLDKVDITIASLNSLDRTPEQL